MMKSMFVAVSVLTVSPGCMAAQSSAPAVGPVAAKSLPTLHMVNGVPYRQPTEHDQIRAYLHETYGVPGVVRTTVRAVIGQIKTTPVGWGQDFPGFGQRFGSEAAITAMDGTTRLGLETLFHEDTRYIRCHGCSAGAKVSNAILAEVSARHGLDGHREFSLTPVLSHVAGPMIAAAAWYPPGNGNPAADGLRHGGTVIAVGFVFHLLDEFVFDHFRKNVTPLQP